MRKIAVVAILVMGLVSLEMAFAFQNEPEGFRGLKWGDPPGEDMIDERKHKDNADWVWYDRSEEFLQVGKATLWSISYGFYKGKFFYVSILTAHDYEHLKDVLILKFGRGVWKPPVTSWFGDTTTVKLEQSGVWEGGVLVIYSTAICLEKQRDERAKTEAEARRKEEEHWRIKDPEAAQEGLDDF